MNTRHLLAIAAFTAVASVQGAPVTFDFKDPKGVNNVVFVTDAPLESINGTASGVSGTLTLDPDKPHEAKGKIVVETASLHVPNPMMNEHLLGDKWLNAKANPEIIFEVTNASNVKKDGDKGTADVTGKFTLNGVTKEITVPVTLHHLPGRLKERIPNQEGDILVLRSKFKIKRSDFNIQPGQNLDKVADDIDLTLSLAGIAAKS